jgi:hypothetical protein
MSGKRRPRHRLNKPFGSTPRPREKARVWTMPTVLGLVLGALGLVALVELRTQIGIEPLAPLQTSQPFAVPFRVHNAGYLSFQIKRVFVFVNELSGNGLFVWDQSFRMRKWEEAVLGSGDDVSMEWDLYQGPVPQKADIIFVVDYRPFGVPITLRKCFRFVGAYGNRWQWLHEPIDGIIQRRIDASIAEHIKHLPDQLPLPR